MDELFQPSLPPNNIYYITATSNQQTNKQTKVIQIEIESDCSHVVDS